METSSKSDPTELLFDSSIREGDRSFTPLAASFGKILLVRPADTLYLEMWLCSVLLSLFIIAVSALALWKMLSGIFNNVHLKENMA